jgi:hypothetical protein
MGNEPRVGENGPPVVLYQQSLGRSLWGFPFHVVFAVFFLHHCSQPGPIDYLREFYKSLVGFFFAGFFQWNTPFVLT